MHLSVGHSDSERREPAEPAGELTSTATSQPPASKLRLVSSDRASTEQRNSRAESPFPAPGVLFDQIAAFLVSEYSALAAFH